MKSYMSTNYLFVHKIKFSKPRSNSFMIAVGISSRTAALPVELS